MRRLLVSITLIALTVIAGLSVNSVPTDAQGTQAAAPDMRLPNRNGSVKFVVLGDTGTGDSSQRAVAQQAIRFRERFKYDFAILLGDNLYGTDSPSAFVRKFEEPYKPLLSAGVKFYAAIGNHDDPNQRLYKPFNMNGERYYSFKPSLTAGVRFFALDSNYMDPTQVQWIEKELAGSGSDWKVAFFHHPLYASGMHGSDEILRAKLEPLFVKHGVNVVFQGHEHFYERIKPQKGIQYFVAGSSAKLRRGDISPTGLTARGYDQALTFMLVEIDGDTMFFQTITDRGVTVDYGTVLKGTDNSVVGTTGAPAISAPRGRGAAPAQPAPAGRGQTTGGR